MSLYGIMKTGVSGMNAQSNKLGTIADNISNQNTTGYKRASTEFSSLVLGSNKNSYNSAGVTTNVRYHVSQQGPVQYTTSAYDLAIQGDGFFPVRDAAGGNALTRAGAFVPAVVKINPKDPNSPTETRLMNTAGYQLLGQKLPANGTPNSMDELVPIVLEAKKLEPSPTTSGVFGANLPARGGIPSAGEYNAISSMMVYDPLGTPVKLNFLFAKTGENSWTVTIDPTDGGPATHDLEFDPATGKLTSGGDPFTVAVPHTTAAGETFNVELDMSDMTQLDADYTPYEIQANGNAPGATETMEFSADGIVYSVSANGTRTPAYQIPLARVRSPDQLTSESGNVFLATDRSGKVELGDANSAGFGKIESGALEQSNVDLASELTSMIEAQSGYTANSKVVQTGSELLDVLVNLKR